MADTTGNHEYEQYGETPDVHVNCAAGDCIPTEALRLALLVLLVVVFLVGVPGNVMLAWMTRLGSYQNLYITWFYHLAVADLFCCLDLPALVLPIILQGHWPYGVMGCRALPFLIFLSMYANVLLLTALSLDIFLLVLKPTWWTENRRLHWRPLACLGAWTLALLLAMPLAIYHQVLQQTYPSQLDCVLDYGSWTVAENTVTAIQFIFGFLGPLVVMASCHGELLHHGGRHRWPLGMAAAMCVLVCWAPYHMLGLVITMAGPSSTLWTRALWVEPFVVGLALAHSCLNPMLILYFGRARLSRSLPAACHWAVKDLGSNNESVINGNSSSHDQVPETEGRLEETNF
ncbi:C5a anaphylatoxin chemotactic receptor 2-like isoform X2 [Pteropus vampyrus]|nr:C5a anaphylatoxin chemotactic receptor 2-like isoform X2 [Pteropus vampyrus]XP_023390978.1 C5a anaphylatoxin chemotactic receptor 2-like isoform X2 [Pteropus vampyrus]XP_023390979.1 C5a anaphylatoxin chemotactic receptor 2-like isoform X2 [Pteropus vampyrus]XP_023390980.1 C5a anaphylatoxin chemotactic receptor 2-like isoform X2 [Pteropus vampyrus]XP_023390981.1 C5a anaphylatoxin chemotactic receptor 2-like isoform X2 [Pteropus vampyrus]XP_023390982.1 C5a anaphylatoxin chemotactic receptor 2